MRRKFIVDKRERTTETSGKVQTEHGHEWRGLGERGEKEKREGAKRVPGNPETKKTCSQNGWVYIGAREAGGGEVKLGGWRSAKRSQDSVTGRC